MAKVVLSEAEKVYIIHGIEDNLRADGRTCLDYRLIELETNVLRHCYGSTLLKIGDTKLLAGVKADIAPPLPLHPNKGWIEVSVDCTPHAHLCFEGRRGDDAAHHISMILKQIVNNDKLVDLKSLSIIPGQQVWSLYVDIMVLGCDGNLIDAASIATKAALFCTKIPNVTVKCDGENEPEIETSYDPFDVVYLNVSNLPLILTFSRVGNEFIVDATSNEECCSKCKLIFAVSPQGVEMMRKVGGPGSLHIENIQDVVELSEELGIKLQEQLMEMLPLERNNEKNRTLF